MQIFAATYVLPVSAPPIAGGAIAVDNGRIVALGTMAELRRIYGAPVREYPGCVIMPGLVNAHTHLELTHFPSWKLRKGIDYSPRTYVDWVIQVIKIRRALTSDELAHSVCEGVRKSLECGTTTVGEILTDRSLLPIYQKSPLSGRLYCEAVGHDPVRCAELLRSLEDALTTFAGDGLKPGLSPHAPHTLSPRFMEEVAGLARGYSVPTVIHLAESPEEAAFFHDSSGKIAEILYPFAGWQEYLSAPRRTTPTAYLDSLGVLDQATTVVHCVHVTPADAEILKRRGVIAVLCPRSNDRLAVGKAPAALLKKAGIPLALGTDSLASNDSLSMWDEMRFLLREFPGTFSPAEALEMATLGAARALHLEREAGSLEKEKRADFLVVRPGRLPAPEEITGAVIEESQIEEIFLRGEPFNYEVADCPTMPKQ
ncbi:MAG: amidohydrolase family protein [Geobacteraceae bacterium]|nr:amidohydrolase family protein [Geobacteraceae bacterium]